MKRGGYLERKSALRRKRPMRKALPRRVTRPGPGSDPAYLDAVRRLPCARPPFGQWSDLDHAGPIHAHHAGRKPGVGMKAPDDTAIALCEKHHRAWHDANGVFKGWTKTDRRMWADAAIDDTRRLVVEAGGSREERGRRG